MYKLSFFAL